MAKFGKKKPRGKPFQKGNTYSVGHGQPSLPREIREIAGMTKKEALARMATFLAMTIEEIRCVYADPTAKGMDAVLCSAILQAYDGNPKHLDIMLDRLYGRVTNDVKITAPKPVLIEYLNGDKDFLGQQPQEE